jgi:hypothetical protein
MWCKPFSVFDVEAKIITKHWHQVTIMIMGYVPDQDMEWVIANNGNMFLTK